MTRIEYITNKDLLAEIHRAKLTYCHFDRPEYSRYDAIVTDAKAITPEFLEQVLAQKLELIAKKGPAAWAGANATGEYSPESLVIRVMTDEHIPDDDGTSRRRRPTNGSTAVRTVFPPFKHYVLRDGVVTEVGRSHWIGSISNGHFSGEHGRMTNRLAEMFMLLVDRYSRRGNIRGYSYVDEMRNHALLQLSQVGLQFDESKSDNPFAFYTQVIKNCMVRIINVERKAQNIRDDLLIMAGAAPSNTRQIDHEFEQKTVEHAPGRPLTEAAPPVPVVPKKRGRKPKNAVVT